MLNKILTAPIRHLTVLILFSFGVIYGSAHIFPTILLLVSSRDWISQLLLQIFAGGELGSAIRNLLSVIAIPLLIGAIPACIYWLAKQRRFPYFMHIVWIVWLVQMTAIIILHH